jgi:transposase
MAGMSRIPEGVAAEMTPAVRAFVDALLQRIDELEAELKGFRKTPQNSSLPPSSLHPHAKPQRPKSKTKRKRGGQPGHERHQRKLIPTAECTDMVTLKPTNCRRCGTKLTGVDPQPVRHQVWELPEIKPLVTEYQLHRLTCECCRETTCGVLPDGVPTGQSGPRLIALVTLLMACFRQSKRRTSLFVESLLNMPCCPSLTVKHQHIATAALRASYEELIAALPSQACLNGDESPTKQANQKAWLWTFVASMFTVFALRGSRAATTISELLGEKFSGVMHCDRAKMYWLLGNTGQLQWCWAHLKRDFQALIDHPDHQLKRLGRDLMRPTKELFKLWSKCRDGTLSRADFETQMKPIRSEIDSLLLRGHGTAADGMCRELFGHRAWLWTFVEVAGVEPTNNAAERSLRHAVIWRRLSFGTQSDRGSRFVETALSVIETCRQQHRDVFEFVTQSVEAHFQHQPAPKLLPGA